MQTSPSPQDASNIEARTADLLARILPSKGRSYVKRDHLFFGRQPVSGAIEIKWRRVVPTLLIVAFAFMVSCQAIAGNRAPTKTAPKAASTGKPATDTAAAPQPTGAQDLHATRGAYGTTLGRVPEEAPAVEAQPQQPDPEPQDRAEPRRPPDDFDAGMNVQLPPEPVDLAERDSAPLVLPEGTELKGELVGKLNSTYASVVKIRLLEPCLVDELVVFPAGTLFLGEASPDVSARRVSVRIHKAVLPESDPGLSGIRIVDVDATVLNEDLSTGLVADRVYKNRGRNLLGAVGRGALRAGSRLGNTITGGIAGAAASTASRDVTQSTARVDILEVFAGHKVVVQLTADLAIPLTARDADPVETSKDE